MLKSISRLLLLGLPLLFLACEDDDDPIIENEEEVITMMTLTLTPDGSQEQVVIGFTDPDGDGPGAPTSTITGQLVANASYRGQLSFGNDMGSINAEIVDEADEHQIFYQVANGLPLTFTYADADGDGNPLGLVTDVTTGAAGSGDLTITLKHEPTKGSTIGIDDAAAAGGTTDVSVTFTNVTVQ